MWRCTPACDRLHAPKSLWGGVPTNPSVPMSPPGVQYVSYTGEVRSPPPPVPVKVLPDVSTEAALAR